MASNRFYITTPLYYVNDRPHLGTAYSTVIADVLTRCHRLFGQETFFLTGTDEHGQKCERAAKQRGLSPQQHCERMRQLFKETWHQLNIDYSAVGEKDGSFFYTSHRYRPQEGLSPSQAEKRVTLPKLMPSPALSPSQVGKHSISLVPRTDDHTGIVQKLLKKLKEKGYIYQADYKGWYCISEEIFYTEKDLVDGKSPSGKELVPLEEKAWFFKMSHFQKFLQKHIEEHADFIRPSYRRNEVMGFLKKPLRDLCVSRPKSRVSWGIEMPFDKSCVVYVWVDALFNYITGLGYGSEAEADRCRFDKYWQESDCALHLIGKDILITHAVYWPCLLKALDLPLPKTILAHGWLLNKETEKMSKSQGAVLDPLDLARDFGGADSLRWFLARDIPLGKDFPISKSLMIKRINEDLADGPGNIFSRIARLAEKHFEGRLPSPPTTSDGLQPLADKLCQNFRQKVESLALSEALREVSLFFDAINSFLEQKAPWKQVKTHKREAGLVLAEALEALRIAAVLISPVMPEKMGELLSLWRKEKAVTPPSAGAKLQENQQAMPSPPVGDNDTKSYEEPFYREKGAFKYTSWGFMPLLCPVRHGAPLFPKISK